MLFKKHIQKIRYFLIDLKTGLVFKTLDLTVIDHVGEYILKV